MQPSGNTFFPFLIGLFVGLFLGLLIGLISLYLYSKTNKKAKEITDLVLHQINLHLAAMSSEALSKNSAQFFKLAKETLSSQMELGEKDLETKKKLIDNTLDSMKKELEQVNSLVSTLEKDREAKFGELSQQLRQATEQTGKLQETTEHLRLALSNTKTRGQWGERMAEDVLRAAGFELGVNYQKQETLESKNRPDYTFLLPRGRKVHMDVKFPLDNYIKYIEADTDESRATHRARFLKDVRSRIQEVTSRDYIDPGNDTINYMIVFIPNEQLFSFICQEDMTILDSALQSNVILCSPLTLFAILAVIRQSIDNFYVEERTLQILKILESFKKHWGEFVKSFENLGKKIEAVQTEYTGLISKRRTQLDRQLVRIDELRRNQELIANESEQEFDQINDGLVVSYAYRVNQEL